MQLPRICLARLDRMRACRMRDSKKYIFILILSILRENDAKINNLNNFYISQNIRKSNNSDILNEYN